jgi:hypothetical protein
MNTQEESAQTIKVATTEDLYAETASRWDIDNQRRLDSAATNTCICEWSHVVQMNLWDEAIVSLISRQYPCFTNTQTHQVFRSQRQ